MNNKKFKFAICSIFSVCLIVLVIFWFYDPEFKHIEDTNGAEDYSVVTITDKNIIDLDFGTIYESDENEINDNKMAFHLFSGVMQIYEKDYTGQNLQVELANFKIEKGNLKVVLLVDEKIIHEFNVNESNQTFKLNNASGCVSIRLAGESASFEMEYYVKENL
jgi:hypothetical protein